MLDVLHLFMMIESPLSRRPNRSRSLVITVWRRRGQDAMFKQNNLLSLVNSTRRGDSEWNDMPVHTRRMPLNPKPVGKP